MITTTPGRLETIAAQYNVPWQLLAKINGIEDPNRLKPGDELKVVRGPFSAIVELDKRQLTLIVEDCYAGRFNLVAVGDMARNVEAARLLTYKSAWMRDNGQRNTKFASFAKSFAADMAMEVAVNAVQVHGGYGYSKEYPVEKLMRDAKLIQIYEGTSQVQRVVMARELLRS